MPDIEAPLLSELPDLEDSPKAAEAMSALGLEALPAVGGVGTPFSMDGAAVPVLKHLFRFIKQVDSIRGTNAWRQNITISQRRLLIGAYVFARELVGERRKDDYNTLKEALGDQFPGKLTGVMADTTDFARARRRGEITPEVLAEITS